MKHKIDLESLVAIIFIIIAVLGIVIIGGRREAKQMASYAKEHNCTWQATGTWYGDNRDFVCKENM